MVGNFQLIFNDLWSLRVFWERQRQVNYFWAGCRSQIRNYLQKVTLFSLKGWLFGIIVSTMPTAGYLSLIGLWTALAGGGLIVSLLATNPSSIGPLGVTLWFIALLTAAAGALTLGLYGTKTYLHLHATGIQRLRYSGRQGLLFGSWLTIILAMSSLRQFNLRDALLLALILGVAELYMRLRQS